jgi:hypothetical protein
MPTKNNRNDMTFVKIERAIHEIAILVFLVFQLVGLIAMELDQLLRKTLLIRNIVL